MAFRLTLLFWRMVIRNLLSALLLSAVSFAGEVKTFPKPGVDFSQYQTYHWVAPRVSTKHGILEDDQD